MERSPSPPLPPDPATTMRAKMHPPFRPEAYVNQSPSLQAQQPPLPVQPRSISVEAKRPNTSRSRATSKPPAPTLHQPQPVRDAVHDAFDQSPVAQNQLDPELVRQVTEQVIRNLQTANVASTPTTSVQPQQSHSAPPPPRPPQQPVARSPTLSSTDSIPQRQYTPPSPEKRAQREESGYGSASPERFGSDSGSTYSKESLRSKASLRSQETPRPVEMDGSTGSLRRSNTAGRRRGGVPQEEKPRRRGSSTVDPHSSPFRRDSKGSESDYYEASRSRVRPPRVPSDVAETTTLEKIWQPLFENGNPTVRLSQFLRGLALHLIDDYEPRYSLVVTPAKMLRFFNETKLEDELYPWEVIFGGRMSYVSLGKMYCKLMCEHHSVQLQHHELPSVPGLTPGGFERLMTCLIMAHPDNEFERLACAVMNMPISNADNKTERFPKELSRRLLPTDGNIQAEQRIIASLNHEPLLVQLRGAVNMPPPPPASAPPQQQTFGERERKPYSSTPFSNAIDDDLGPTSVPIERERKPYTAKEGTGKKYSEGERDRESQSRPPTQQYRPETVVPPQPPPNIRSSRSNSGVPTQATYSSSNGSEPMNIPSRGHRQSVNQGPPPAMFNIMNGHNGSVPKGRRTPPPRTYGRSEPRDIGNVPTSEYTSNLHPGFGISGARDQYGGESDDDAGRRRHHTRRRTQQRDTNDDDTAGERGYPIPPRPPPSAQGYDPNYGVAGGIPVGSYPRSNGFTDNRRQTWYGAPTSTGGTDGYESFANGGNGHPSNTYGSSVQH